ncbi:MAG TPA: 2-oxoglutarate and iron-dependent oxygenase domain-containing protein [Xanthobacteraceae bacterium]|jgi:isopenicillin N synthase-like dioxygenase
MVLYSEPRITDAIPTIDLSATFAGGEAARQKAAADIGAACRNIGFFYVARHGIEQSLVERAFAESKRFFAQSDIAKCRCSKRPGTNGYEPMETQRLDSESPPDLKESFNFSALAKPGTPDHVLNIWPHDLPGFREALESYHQKIRALGRHVSGLIALSLGMPYTFFDPTFENQKAALRLLRYPPQPANAKFNQLGAGAHTDWGWITLLAQDKQGGLEVETASGNWVRVDPIPGTFVVNLGDLVVNWSNGLYHSSLHRVMNNRAGSDRYSIVLFYDHAYETPVEALKTCIKPGEEPKFAPCISGDHRKAKYLASRGHVQATP